MPINRIHALLIEDDPDDILLLKDALAEIGMGKIKLDYVDRLSRGLIQLGVQSYDVILLDLNLPDSRGLDTLNTTIKRFPKIPVVVLSGLADDTITIEAVRRGAQDYLVKGEINGPLVMRVIHYAIERKLVEAVLRANEVKYRTLVETTPYGITLADLEGKLILCNQQAARLHGYSKPDTMIGINFLKLVAPHDRKTLAMNTQKTLNEGRVITAEYTIMRRDGSEFPGEISMALQRNSTGAATGFISIIRDITEREKAAEVEQQLLMLEKEFLFNVSREMRAPLRSLMKNVNQAGILKTRDSLKQNELLNQASKEAYHLMDMVNELSDFSLIENEQLALNSENVDLCRMIADVMQSLDEKAKAKQVALITAPMDPGLAADVDRERLRRIIRKLVENAIKFSEKGGSVLVTGKRINGEVVINVIDEGCGIIQEDISKLFEKYYQVSHASEQNQTGIGLGLYIAKRILEAQGGTLSVSSQLGAGSTFTITIPAQRTAPPPASPKS